MGEVGTQLGPGVTKIGYKRERFVVRFPEAIPFEGLIVSGFADVFRLP